MKVGDVSQCQSVGGFRYHGHGDTQHRHCVSIIKLLCWFFFSLLSFPISFSCYLNYFPARPVVFVQNFPYAWCKVFLFRCFTAINNQRTIFFYNTHTNNLRILLNVPHSYSLFEYTFVSFAIAQSQTLLETSHGGICFWIKSFRWKLQILHLIECLCERVWEKVVSTIKYSQ